MATELASAYVQIVPSMKGVKGMLSKEMGGEGDSSGKTFGTSMMGKIKTVIAAAGIGKALASAITEGANLQQSIGGIETLFKESADKVKKNADNAYRTVGISANEYMEQTTSFAASLLQSLGNNTAKAADAADMAMTDMADNANKMGTSMESIQNAYQGFAKQNYTMLDNLKLGYGGTKEEMQRLLNDAQKLTGVKYDISNLSDVYSAIHVIQGELGITGTAAKEASTTLSGSLASMKASFQNLIGNLSLGQDITGPLIALQETVHTFLIGNLLPMVVNILNSLPEVLNGTLSMIIESMNLVSNNADQIVEQGVQFVTTLVTGIISNIPYLIAAAGNMIASLGTAIIETDWQAVGNTLISNLRGNLDQAAGEILGTDGNIIDSILNAITDNLPAVLEKGVEIVTTIINGILKNLPTLIQSAGNLITKFVSKILDMLPSVLSAGVKLILNIVNGIINNLPQIVSSAAQMISKFLSTIGQKLPQILQSGIEIIGKLAAGLIQAIPNLVSKIPEIITRIKNAFSETDWMSVGKNIISGIANGLRNAGSQLWEAVKGVLGGFKDKVLSFFGIHSPSTWGVYVGEMVDKGIANGLTDGINPINKAISEVTGAVSVPVEADLKYWINKSDAGETVRTPEVFYEILKILMLILDKDSDTKIYFKDREVARALREMGVAFA